MSNPTNLSQLKKLPQGTPLFIQNHVCPNRSRHTFVKNNYSAFFSVDSNGNESWIFNKAPKAGQFLFKDGKTEVFDEAGKLYLTIYTAPEYIATFPTTPIS